jgi:exopolysaccharide biosynthesis polyprenyl glycosylphosphotransferase
VGLLLASPLALITALAIRIESKGPVLYSQERTGYQGKPFTIYKFRSMVADAEKASGPVWAQEEDPRITKVGRFIRKTRLDEIPQLWNVLIGTMSFVGPRPERPHFVEELQKELPFYAERHNVKPGVTGWAQICYPYGSSKQAALEKLNYDLYYIKHFGLSMDITILFQTVKILLFGGGGR